MALFFGLFKRFIGNWSDVTRVIDGLLLLVCHYFLDFAYTPLFCRVIPPVIELNHNVILSDWSFLGGLSHLAAVVHHGIKVVNAVVTLVQASNLVT